jgi:hypothetical protein
MNEKYGRAEQEDEAAVGKVNIKVELKDKYGTAEMRDDAAVGSEEQVQAYYKFVGDVKERYGLKTDKEADAKAQELIRDYHQDTDGGKSM